MRRLAIALTGLVALVHLSCSDASGPGDQANSRISITNNASTLASRVTYLDTSIPIDSAHVGYPTAPVPFASATVSRSSAATSVAYGTSVYATSGDAGSLFVIDPTLFTVTSSIALHDARWVAAGGGQVAVVQGTPGTLDVYSESNMSVVGSWPFKGADIAQSKSQLELVGGKAFIAAGDSGVQVLSASTGAVVGSVPRPNPDSLGLSPSVVVTNAVAIDQDLMFISNGEAGVYLAQGSQRYHGRQA